MKKSCALCLEEKKLCHSHIIPEFLYKSLYNDDHRIEVLSILPHRKDWYEQKGLREYLLCAACEQKLSVWEGYGRKVLNGGTPFEASQEGRLVTVKGLHYEHFKLFQLSLLWRASISKLTFFERVTLGAHEEKLRIMLHASIPGTALEYPCIMFALKSATGVITDLIVQPEKIRLEGHIAYKFVFGGFLWTFIVSSHPARPFLSHIALNESGSLSFMVRPPEEMRPLHSFAKRHRELGRS